MFRAVPQAPSSGGLRARAVAPWFMALRTQLSAAAVTSLAVCAAAERWYGWRARVREESAKKAKEV